MSENADYLRGVVDTRLNHLDDEIAAINTVLTQAVETAQVMVATLQTLTEARTTDAATRVSLAAAVKAERDVHESADRAAWSPVAKLITITGAFVGVIGITWAVLTGG